MAGSHHRVMHSEHDSWPEDGWSHYLVTNRQTGPACDPESFQLTKKNRGTFSVKLIARRSRANAHIRIRMTCRTRVLYIGTGGW